MNIFSNISLDEKTNPKLKFRDDLLNAKKSIYNLNKTLESFDTNVLKIGPILHGNKAILENIKQFNVGKLNGSKKITLQRNMSSKLNPLFQSKSNQQFSLMEQYTKLGSMLTKPKVVRSNLKEKAIESSKAKLKNNLMSLFSNKRNKITRFADNSVLSTITGEKTFNEKEEDTYFKTNTVDRLYISNYSNWNTLPSKEEESETKANKYINNTTVYSKIPSSNYQHSCPRKRMFEMVKDICDDNHRKLDKTFHTMHDRIDKFDDKIRHHNPKNIKLRKNMEILKDTVNIRKKKMDFYPNKTLFLVNPSKSKEKGDAKSFMLNYIIEKDINAKTIDKSWMLKEKKQEAQHIERRMRCKNNNAKISLLVRDINIKHSLLSKHVNKIQKQK